jgi:MFS family permease
MNSSNPLSAVASGPNIPWWRELTRYHWWVLIVAALGWLFDTMDQRIFVLARTPALTDLMPGMSDDARSQYAAYATSIFILGWATGGLVFGLFGDRWGRTRTMMITILVYSLFTGLSALSRTWLEFALYRFLAGTGVGGEFAAGVALVAEVMPSRARPYCLGMLQALSAIGNISGSMISRVIGPQAEFGTIAGWRLLFLVGILPALLVVIIFWRLREPESWVRAKERALGEPAGTNDSHSESRPDELHKQLGDLREIFRDRRWRYHTIIGMILGLAGQIGLWGVGFWTPELIRGALLEQRKAVFAAQTQRNESRAGQPGADLSLENLARLSTGSAEDARARLQTWKAENDKYVADGTLLQDVGAFFGVTVFTYVTGFLGRRRTFALAFFAALAATTFTFGMLDRGSQVYWMMPLLGFCNLAVFGGYAIYFPELYPTRLRSTGTGFCYNVARYITALGPLALGRLTAIFGAHGYAMPLRPAAISLAMIYLVGVFVLPFAPETKDRPLPE